MSGTNIETKGSAETPEEKPFLKVIVHSFFIIPFLIAVFCLLLFAAVNLLTREQRSAQDYLEDVKTGGSTKRWQGAFELSKILASPNLVPKDERFTTSMIAAFKQSKHDDNRVRQYLALAMGRTGNQEFVNPILAELPQENEENLSYLLYSLGMLKAKNTVPALSAYADHSNGRIRSIVAVALGNISDASSIPVLKKMLTDPEPNVQWGAAISLAQMKERASKEILLQLLNRNYLKQFPEVDPNETVSLILMSINASTHLNDATLNERIKELSQSDPNMKVRSAAYTAVERVNLN